MPNYGGAAGAAVGGPPPPKDPNKPFGQGNQNQDLDDAANQMRADMAGGVSLGNIGQLANDANRVGQAANNPNPYYGGYKGGANDAANYYAGLAGDARGQAAPSVDLTNSNQDRGYGMGALGLLQGAANGTAPSAAQAQFGQNLSQAIQSQQAMANSARGGGAALAAAQRQGAMQGAQMAGSGAQQAAMLRAQEMATARGQYAQYAQSQQGLDAQTAQNIAAMQQRQNEINNSASLGYLGLAQGSELGQLQADTSRYGANTGAQTSRDQLNYQSGKDTASAVMGAIGTGAMIAASDYRLKEDVRSESSRKGGELRYTSDERTKADAQPAGDDLFPGEYATPEQYQRMTGLYSAMTSGDPDRIAQARNQPGLTAAESERVRQWNEEGRHYYERLMADEQQRRAASAATTAATKQPSSPSMLQRIGSALSNYSRSLSGDDDGVRYMSDEDAKTVRPGGNTEADRFLSSLKPYSYRYRDAKDEPTDAPTGGRYLGIMAQNVEKTDAGKQIVRETPRGKAIEVAPMVSGLAAGTGRLHERVDAIEQAIAAMQAKKKRG